MLNHVKIPGSITAIPKYAFAQCYSLSEIDIPKSVKTIADYAFYQDTALTRVFIPASVAEISSKDAFSYVDQMIIEGALGSYAEDWAKRNGAKEFVDKSVPIQTLSLAGDAESLILPRNGVFAPVFDAKPANNTDVLTLTSSSSAVAVRNGYILYATQAFTDPVTITATATSGKTFEFNVTCEDMTGLQVPTPEVIHYAVGDSLDLSGLAPKAVFKSGPTQRIYNYPRTADTIRDKVLEWTVSDFDSSAAGTQTVTVSYGKVSADFQVEVYESADKIPLSLRRVERTESGLRAYAHGVAGNAGLCSVVSFDADGRFLGAELKTLSQSEIAAGYADFPAIPGAASVKAFLCDSAALAPAYPIRTLALS